eukprot:g6077.t1
MPGLAETAPGGPRTHNAQVDETLFGTKKSKSTSKDISGLMIVGKDTVQKKKGHPKQAEAAAADAGVVASIIAASDLNRIKEATKIFTKAEEMANKKINEAAKAEKEAKSRARKEKMILMEEERKMKMAMQMSDFEKEEQASTNGLLQKAKDKMDEAHDDVKHMNAMMMYSKVVTIRDAQVQEKRYIHQEREEEEAQLDTMMEIERLKALKMYEERNKARAMDQRRGAQVIIEQIKDRQSQRLREEESRDQERAFILKQIEAMKQEEVELQKAKKVAAAKLMGEVADALRAKRAFEAAERAARAKEQQERNRVEAINEELSVARKRQTAEKEKRLAEQAKQERDEFDRIIAVQIQQEEAERDKATGEMKARYLHCDELRKQIAAREEKQLQGRRNALEEGNQVRADLAVERKKLEKIKSRKIEELKKCGVPEKYWSELAKKKIAV